LKPPSIPYIVGDSYGGSQPYSNSGDSNTLAIVVLFIHYLQTQRMLFETYCDWREKSKMTEKGEVTVN